jgi:multidrug efflux system membrane fusion protein
MVTSTTNGSVLRGKMQLIDNQVDAASGTVRVRAVFDNPDGTLLPGQFARLRMGQPDAEPRVVVSERAVGTDQDKRFVMVVDGNNKAAYREVWLGPTVEGLRVVTSGLEPGERIVVNGLQRVRPGAVVAPEPVAMDSARAEATSAAY